MKLNNINKVAFIGAGIIGSGLAVNSMLSGYQTYLQTRSKTELMKQRVDEMLRFLVEEAVITEEDAQAALERTVFTTSVEEACKDAGFIQESGPERTELKQALYEQIEAVCPPDAIICSSTTGLMPSELQKFAQHPERIMVGHPYNPAFLLPLVEVCGGEKTTPENIERAMEFYRSIGKEPLLCRKEVYGFIVNRASWAVLNECKKNVFEGVCSAEDMDKALMYGPGLRMAITGQLLTISLGVGEGGLRALAMKYKGGECDEVSAAASDSVDEWMANRSPEEGNTYDEINHYLNQKIVGVLRTMGKL